MCELIFKVKDTHAEVPSHSPSKEGRVVSSFSAPRSWTQSFKFCFLPVSSVQLSLVPTALPPMMWHFMSIQIRVCRGVLIGIGHCTLFFLKWWKVTDPPIPSSLARWLEGHMCTLVLVTHPEAPVIQSRYLSSHLYTF